MGETSSGQGQRIRLKKLADIDTDDVDRICGLMTQQHVLLKDACLLAGVRPDIFQRAIAGEEPARPGWAAKIDQAKSQELSHWTTYGTSAGSEKNAAGVRWAQHMLAIRDKAYREDRGESRGQLVVNFLANPDVRPALETIEPEHRLLNGTT